MRIYFSILLILLLCSNKASSQQSPVAPGLTDLKDRRATSLGAALKRAGTAPVRILYIHGIGSTGHGDSLELQASICHQLKRYLNDVCEFTSKTPLSREYADEGYFARDNAADDGLDSTVSKLLYMGAPIWASWDEWHASAPFVDHYQLRLKSGKAILIDELNWWPLMFAIKCKNMMPNETLLAGKLTGSDDNYLSICQQQEVGMTAVEVRSFDWLRAAHLDVAQLNEKPNHAVAVNRWAKVGLMDWRFSDALLGVGPLENVLVEGIRQLLMKSLKGPLDPNAQFITISHSLGSFLLFSALHSEFDVQDARRTEVFNYVLGHLEEANFFANQIPLLEMAKLGTPTSKFAGLDAWSKARKKYLRLSDGPTSEIIGRVVSWSDANDLLTWYLGEDFKAWQAKPGSGIEVDNEIVKNSSTWNWLGLLENPERAHDNYSKNQHVIRSLLEPPKSLPEPPK